VRVSFEGVVGKDYAVMSDGESEVSPDGIVVGIGHGCLKDLRLLHNREGGGSRSTVVGRIET
jgi:hypothetical protein